MNSGEFTQNLKTKNIVDFQRFFVKIGGETHNGSVKYVGDLLSVYFL